MLKIYEYRALMLEKSKTPSDINKIISFFSRSISYKSRIPSKSIGRVLVLNSFIWLLRIRREVEDAILNNFPFFVAKLALTKSSVAYEDVKREIWLSSVKSLIIFSSS